MVFDKIEAQQKQRLRHRILPSARRLASIWRNPQLVDPGNVSAPRNTHRTQEDSHDSPIRGTMDQYTYRPLDKATQEIRLVKVLPGHFDDPFQLEIVHVPFTVPEPVPVERMSIPDIRGTLPQGYDVYETLDGRYIFYDRETGRTSWTHPDPDLKKRLYDPPEVLNRCPNFEPSYEAISYTWGDEETTSTVEILEISRSARSRLLHLEEAPRTSLLYIRPNLHLALRHFRDAHALRSLWIDAICINQADKNEKNDQVKRMADIYRLASRVVVWLGPASSDNSSRRGLRILEYIGKQVEVTKGYRAMHSTIAQEQEWYVHDCPLPYSKDDYLAVKAVLERPWFDRLWIWQEIHLANHRAIIQCGTDSVSWYFFRRAITTLASKRDLRAVIPWKLLKQRDDLCQPTTTSDLRAILRRTSAANYSIEQDRIFAVLGLLDPELIKRIGADYSLPIGEVFKDVCLAYVDYYTTIGFLEHCQGPQQGLRGIPSWVPDWSRSQSNPLFSQYASGMSTSGPPQLVGLSGLEVHGIKCGTIRQVSTPILPKGDIRTILRQWQPGNLEARKYTTGESLEAAFFSTLCGGKSKERWREYTFLTVDEAISLSRCYLWEDDVVEDDSTLDRHISTISESVQGRCFIQTDDHMGLCPKSARTDDIVSILLGCAWPVIIRPCVEQTYQVVGISYIHGLSDAVAILGPLPDKWRVHYEVDYNGYAMQAFKDLKTGQVVYDDPRLGPLPDGWEYERDYQLGERETREYFNQATGLANIHDPRLAPEELRKRGVPIRTFHLV